MRERTGGGILRPGLHRRLVPILLVLTLASSLGVAALAYFGERDSAINTAQTQAAQDVRVLRQLLADQGAGVTTNNGQLVVGQDSAQLVLNGDATVVDRAHDATAAYAAIYQLQGPSLIGISGNVPTADAQGNPLPGTRLLGDTIVGPAYDALLGECGSTDTQACHHSYNGVVSLRGVSYVAAYAPLYDNGGAFVGALAAAMPLDGVLAPVAQQAALLALVGLLLGMVALVAGYWVLDSSARRYFAALDAQLVAVSGQATEVAALARLQVNRAAQQEQIAQQTGEQAHTLDALAGAMERDYAGLRDSAGELWAAMSQPGAATDPARAAAQARQAAVIAARVGTGAAQARDLSRHIAVLMRQVVAQSHSATDGGRELDLHATELLATVGQAGAKLEERLALPRQDAGVGPSSGTGTQRAVTGRQPVVSGSGSATQTGIRRTLASRPGQTGAVPRVSPSDGHTREATGEQSIYRPGLSRATGGFPTMPRTSQKPQSPQWEADAPGQVPPFSMRSTNPPSRFPTPPSRAYNPPGQLPRTPTRFPNPPSQVFREGRQDSGAFIITPRTGEWPAQHPAAPLDSPPSDATAHPSEPNNRLGLPDLSGQDHIPDWRGYPE